MDINKLKQTQNTSVFWETSYPVDWLHTECTCGKCLHGLQPFDKEQAGEIVPGTAGEGGKL